MIGVILYNPGREKERKNKLMKRKANGDIFIK